MAISPKEKDIIQCFQKLKEYHNEEDVFIILKYMFEITDKWFEYYVRDYFSKTSNYERIEVIWGLKDWWIDIEWKFWNKLTLIQCKQYKKNNHIQDKELLKFIKDTKKYKKRIWDVLSVSLYLITTNRVNREARKFWELYNIEIRDHRKILEMNKKLDIDDFINKNQKDNKLITNINTRDVVDRLYSQKLFWMIPYYIHKIINKFLKIFNKELVFDFDKIDKDLPNKKIKIKESIEY